MQGARKAGWSRSAPTCRAQIFYGWSGLPIKEKDWSTMGLSSKRSNGCSWVEILLGRRGLDFAKNLELQTTHLGCV